ncbi:MAG: cupin domain-containing protein [Salinarimonas sp.]|nr:cupin domain-containing protein [Salinarimonas sp.]
MEIFRAESRPSRRVAAEYFTGEVWQDPIVETPDPARAKAVRVIFSPGARTNWHTHPLGQSLHVVAGIGRIQVWGGPVRIIRPGDTVWIPPGEKHWHGAAPDRAMTHIAIHEHIDGVHVEWLERVDDAQYAVAPHDKPVEA